METTQRGFLSLMLLGEFETAIFCLKAPSQRSSPLWPAMAKFRTTTNPQPTHLVSLCNDTLFHKQIP
ncbi:hypothetical protein AAAB34_14025, partial [Lacticaseibacillus casei]|uniref:hypothetical protein n=1 Tax=Lacticaseibacillus casei TaxID=1582 RepID=UPI0030F0305B